MVRFWVRVTVRVRDRVRVEPWVISYQTLGFIAIITMMHSVQPKPPAIVIVHQNGLSSASCRTSVAVTPVCVTADLVNPGGGWPTIPPFVRWPLAISRLGTYSKDLIGWYVVWLWQHGRIDRVVVFGQWMRLRVGQYGGELHHWRQSHASWCVRFVADTAYERGPVFSLGLSTYNRWNIWNWLSNTHTIIHGSYKFSPVDRSLI